MQIRFLWISIAAGALGILIVLAAACQPEQQTTGTERVQSTEVDEETAGESEHHTEDSLVITSYSIHYTKLYE